MSAIISIDVGKKNLALCCLRPGADPHGRDDKILHWIVTSTLPACHALVDTLRTAGVLEWLPDVREVVIERQPAKNGPMVRLQCYMEMFFTMHDKMVTLVDSRHKLSFAAASPWWPGGIPDKWTYYTRKKLAVQSTAKYLDAIPQAPGLKEMFERSPKRDDYADSLLQGMAYAHFVAPLENARAQAKRARVPAPRRPSAQQLATGKLTKSHVVSLVLAAEGALESTETLHKACDAYTPLRKGLVRHFGSVEYAHQVLVEWNDQREATAAETKATKKKKAPAPDTTDTSVVPTDPTPIVA